MPPPLPPSCLWLPYDVEWFAFHKTGPGYVDMNFVLQKGVPFIRVVDAQALSWVLEHYDQGMLVYNAGTLPFDLAWTIFPYGLTTELVRFTNEERTQTELVDELVDAYNACPHYYYLLGGDMQWLCLHGDDLSYDLGSYGGEGTFTATLGGACLCPGSDEVILE